MQITLTLSGMLGDYLPSGDGARERPLEVRPDATVGAVLDELGVPRELVHLVLVNGVRVAPSRLGTTPLHARDALAVWPPLSGG